MRSPRPHSRNGGPSSRGREEGEVPTSKGTEGREWRREGTDRGGRNSPKVKLSRINTAHGLV